MIRPTTMSGDGRVMAKRLARINVGEMDLDGRQLAGGYRVANRHAGMRIGRRVYHQHPRTPARPLDTIHDRPFAVRLEGVHLEAQFAAQLLERPVDVAQSRASVNLRLALAEQIQVRAVDYQHRGRRLSRAACGGLPSGRFCLSSPSLAGIEAYQPTAFKQPPARASTARVQRTTRQIIISRLDCRLGVFAARPTHPDKPRAGCARPAAPSPRSPA